MLLIKVWGKFGNDAAVKNSMLTLRCQVDSSKKLIIKITDRRSLLGSMSNINVIARRIGLSLLQYQPPRAALYPTQGCVQICPNQDNRFVAFPCQCVILHLLGLGCDEFRRDYGTNIHGMYKCQVTRIRIVKSSETI